MGGKFVTVGLRLLSALLLVSICLGADSLVLIRPENAGPNVPAAIAGHPSWILWPTNFPLHSENGLLSVLSGDDWMGDLDDIQFRSVGKSRWQSQGLARLSSIGYFGDRKAFLKGKSVHLLIGRGGLTSESALLLATNSENSPIEGLVDVSPDPSGLTVFQARSWDDVAYLRSRTQGQTVVLEFPPDRGRWSRFWMFSDRTYFDSFPTSRGLGLPGVVEARDLYRVIESPDSVTWTTQKPSPQPWMDRATDFSPRVRALLLASIYIVLVFGTGCVNLERSYSWLRGLILLLLGAPAIDLAAGNICNRAGISAWIIVVPTLALCLSVALNVAPLISRDDGQESDRKLLILAFAGSVISLACNSFHSDYSPILAASRHPLSYEIVGLTAGYLAALLVQVSGWKRRAWVVAMSAGATVWFGLESSSFLPFAIVPLALVSLLPSAWYGFLLVAMFSFVARPPFDHFCWTPFGLFQRSSDRTGLDVSEYLLNLFSFPVVGSAIIAAILGIMTIGFGQHQLVRAYRLSPVCRVLGRLTGYLLCISVALPGTLAAALTVMLGCALVLVYVATA